MQTQLPIYVIHFKGFATLTLSDMKNSATFALALLSRGDLVDFTTRFADNFLVQILVGKDSRMLEMRSSLSLSQQQLKLILVLSRELNQSYKLLKTTAESYHTLMFPPTVPPSFHNYGRTIVRHFACE